jgi:hypothetical protein
MQRGHANVQVSTAVAEGKHSSVSQDITLSRSVTNMEAFHYFKCGLLKNRAMDGV